MSGRYTSMDETVAFILNGVHLQTLPLPSSGLCLQEYCSEVLAELVQDDVQEVFPLFMCFCVGTCNKGLIFVKLLPCCMEPGGSSP